MTEKKAAKLHEYFDSQTALCRQRGQKLLADSRKDEADFEKVRANVYDIFSAILCAAIKNGDGSPEAVREFFLLKAGQIPDSWAASRAQAEAHGDWAKAQIEEIKLETANEVRDMFAKVWEGGNDGE